MGDPCRFSRRHVTNEAHLAARERRETTGTNRFDPPKRTRAKFRVKRITLRNGSTKRVRYFVCWEPAAV